MQVCPMTPLFELWELTLPSRFLLLPSSSGAKPTPRFERLTTTETPLDGSLDPSTELTGSTGRAGSRRLVVLVPFFSLFRYAFLTQLTYLSFGLPCRRPT